MLYTVNSSAALVTALKVAHSGDTIQLASGTYAPVLIDSAKFDGAGVTITSQNPAGGAIMTGVYIRGSEGLNIKNVEMTVDPSKPDFPFYVFGSSRISFDHLNVHGSLDGNAQNDMGALMIRNSTGVTVTNSDFHELKFGIQHLDSTGVTVTGNTFHEIRTDGVRGGGSSHVTITNNYFTNFQPVEGDHADAIQFWTSNTTTSATDIVISGNTILRGSGQPMQGIFMRDEVGSAPYEHVTVTNNLVVGSMFHGITVSSTIGGVVSGNEVVALPDQKTWIRVANSTDVALTNNLSSQYVMVGNTNVTESSDNLVNVPSDGGMQIVGDWVKAHSAIYSTVNYTSAFADAVQAATDTIESTRLQAYTVFGTSGADKLYTDGVHDTRMEGGDGNDALTGGGVGHNTMVGGAGDDTYYVRSTFDTVVESAGAGDDTVVTTVDFRLGDNVERLRMGGDAKVGEGNSLDNRITGGTNSEDLYGRSGDDQIQGGAGDDRVYGGEGADGLSGDAGNDTVVGEAGNDRAVGNEGNDSVSGGLGNDSLEGGAGSDTLSGGTGADIFSYRQGDIATGEKLIDFSHAEGDKISLTAIDASTMTAGDQKFAFIGTTAFHHIAGELRYEVAAGGSTLMGDLNGDGVADFKLLLPGATSLVSGDFLL